MVEQRNHNPLVGGPNPSAATRINKRPDGSFFYSVRRGDEGQPDGGPTRRQKADGSMPVPRSFNEGGFAQGNEAQRNQSLLRYQEKKHPNGCFPYKVLPVLETTAADFCSHNLIMFGISSLGIIKTNFPPVGVVSKTTPSSESK